MNPQLTANFNLSEFTKSQYAIRHGIDNNPDDVQISNIKKLCEDVLQPLRHWFNQPINISSGFRSEALNHAIGGSSRSLHCHGCAADIDKVGSIELIDVVRFIYERLDFTELIAEYLPGGWIHVGIIEGREKERTLKLKDKNHNYLICKDFETLEAIVNG